MKKLKVKDEIAKFCKPGMGTGEIFKAALNSKKVKKHARIKNGAK